MKKIRQSSFVSYIEEANSRAELIRKQKMETYNGSQVGYDEYTSLDNFYIYQLWNKMLRIISIVKGSKNNYESLEDSLIDLINYAKLAYAEQKTKRGGSDAK
tara:strand:- start:1894 stop:2199 length:306 start_codon:yes stop_codon:yes gene_type:complete